MVALGGRSVCRWEMDNFHDSFAVAMIIGEDIVQHCK